MCLHTQVLSRLETIRLHTSSLKSTPNSLVYFLPAISLNEYSKTRIKTVQQRRKNEEAPKAIKGKKKIKVRTVKGSANNFSDQNYGKILILDPGNIIKMW